LPDLIGQHPVSRNGLILKIILIKNIKNIGKSNTTNPDERNKKILDCNVPDVTKGDYLDHLPRNTYRNCDNINSGCYNGTCESIFSFACVTESDVLKSMLLIQSNAIGVDDINPKVIKILLPKILPYITFIYNTAICK